jgi:thioredoxin 1
VLKVNFDTQKEAVKRFGAKRQSMFIMYKGVGERMRSMADTQAESIKELIDAGMN